MGRVAQEPEGAGAICLQQGSPDGPRGRGQMPDVLKRDPALSHVVPISQCPSSPHTALPEVLRLRGAPAPICDDMYLPIGAHTTSILVSGHVCLKTKRVFSLG